MRRPSALTLDDTVTMTVREFLELMKGGNNVHIEGAINIQLISPKKGKDKLIFHVPVGNMEPQAVSQYINNVRETYAIDPEVEYLFIPMR